LVPGAHGGVGSEDGNIFPWGGLPVGVVVTLLLALETIGTTIVVLDGRLGIVLNISVGNIETFVSVTDVASAEVFGRLMITNIGVVVVGEGRSGSASRITSSRETILHARHGISASILQDNLAVNVSNTARVLSSPFYLELAARVVVHLGSFDSLSIGWVSAMRTGITSCSIILGVEKAIGILTITLFTATVVRTARIVHIDISQGEADEEKSKNEGSHLLSHLLCVFR
jgi:hypothetical protein